MKKIFLFFLLLVSSTAFTQSLADADRLFDRFEYASAASAYENLAKRKNLDVETRKNMAYSYYAIGDYEKCYSVVDSLIQNPDIEPFFLYMHGNAAIAQGKYDEAKRSFQNYSSKDDRFNVDILIQSCDSLKVWQENDDVKIVIDSGNISKADINGSNYKDGYFVFRETGIDSSGFEIKMEFVDNGELLLTQPYLIKENGEIKKIGLPSEYKYSAVTSVAPIFGTEYFVLTLSTPSHSEELLRAPHLYLANWDTVTNSFNNIVPWTYSGIEDSTSCAYATVNDKGDCLIFTKQGRNTNGSDLYMSFLSNGIWSNPVGIEELNTGFDEISPMFSGDTLLTFASNGRPGYGSLDIYTVSFKDGKFGSIQHPKSPINSFRDDFNYKPINDTLVLLTSNRANGTGDDDIYNIIYPKISPPTPDTTGNTLTEYLANWTDQMIYFDYDIFSVKDQKIIEEIAEGLKRYDDLKIIIEGHTDSRGVDIYNMELGKQRAQTVHDEFLRLGVNGDNLQIISKGETDPLVNCSNGCAEEQHQKNRVVIIKLQLKKP